VKDDRLYLHHMLERCRRITRFIGPGRETSMVSEELQDAVIRNVEVIGEAAKRVSGESRGRLASLDWKAICGMRDVLIQITSAWTWTKSGTWHPPGSGPNAPSPRWFDDTPSRNPEARRIKHLAVALPRRGDLGIALGTMSFDRLDP